MGVSFYTVAEKEVVGFDDFIDDKGLAQVDETLWLQLFEALNITSFFEFIQASEEQLEDENFDLPPELRETQWFDASEGLHVFTTLKQHFATHPHILPPEVQAWVIESLQMFEDILSVYQQQNLRFHLGMSF